MTKIINKLQYFIDGIAEQVSLVDAEALLQVTDMETENVSITDVNGLNPNTLTKTGLTVTDASGIDGQLLSQAVLKNLVVLQDSGSVDRAATKDQLDQATIDRLGEDDTISQALAGKITSSTDAESAVQLALSNEIIAQGLQDGLVRDEFSSVDGDIRAEFALDDGDIGTDLQNEIDARVLQASGMSGEISDEYDRAILEEGNIQGNVDSAINSESNLSLGITNLTSDIGTEMNNRFDQYSPVLVATNDERDRAVIAEGLLQDSIDDMPSFLDWQNSVKSVVLTLPSSPAAGDRYFVDGGFGVDAYSISEYRQSAWHTVLDLVGMMVTVDNEPDSIYYYTTGGWVKKIWENYALGAGLALDVNTVKIPTAGIVEGMIASLAVTGAKIADSAIDNVTIEKSGGMGAPALIVSNTTYEFDQPMFAQFYEGSVVRGYASQSFTLASPTSITEVQFRLESNGDSPFTAGSIRVSLYEGDANDNPTGSVLGDAEILATSLNGAAAFRSFTFSSPIAVTARKYCAVLSKHDIPNPPSSSVRAVIGCSVSVDQISGGKQAESSDGTSWSFSNGDTADLMMKVYAATSGAVQLALKDLGITGEKIADGAATDVHFASGIQMSKIAGLTQAIANMEVSSTSIATTVNALTMAIGDILIPESATKMAQAMANSPANCLSVVGALKSIAEFTALTDAVVLISGDFDANPEVGITLVAGDIVYLSATQVGKVTNVAPSATGQCVMEIGVALSATRVLLRSEFKYSIV